MRSELVLFLRSLISSKKSPFETCPLDIAYPRITVSSNKRTVLDYGDEVIDFSLESLKRFSDVRIACNLFDKHVRSLSKNNENTQNSTYVIVRYLAYRLPRNVFRSLDVIIKNKPCGNLLAHIATCKKFFPEINLSRHILYVYSYYLENPVQLDALHNLLEEFGEKITVSTFQLLFDVRVNRFYLIQFLLQKEPQDTKKWFLEENVEPSVKRWILRSTRRSILILGNDFDVPSHLKVNTFFFLYVNEESRNRLAEVKDHILNLKYERLVLISMPEAILNVGNVTGEILYLINSVLPAEGNDRIELSFSFYDIRMCDLNNTEVLINSITELSVYKSTRIAFKAPHYMEINSIVIDSCNNLSLEFSETSTINACVLKNSSNIAITLPKRVFKFNIKSCVNVSVNSNSLCILENVSLVFNSAVPSLDVLAKDKNLFFLECTPENVPKDCLNALFLKKLKSLFLINYTEEVYLSFKSLNQLLLKLCSAVHIDQNVADTLLELSVDRSSVVAKELNFKKLKKAMFLNVVSDIELKECTFSRINCISVTKTENSSFNVNFPQTIETSLVKSTVGDIESCIYIVNW